MGVIELEFDFRYIDAKYDEWALIMRFEDASVSIKVIKSNDS